MEALARGFGDYQPAEMQRTSHVLEACLEAFSCLRTTDKRSCAGLLSFSIQTSVSTDNPTSLERVPYGSSSSGDVDACWVWLLQAKRPMPAQ